MPTHPRGASSFDSPAGARQLQSLVSKRVEYPPPLCITSPSSVLVVVVVVVAAVVAVGKKKSALGWCVMSHDACAAASGRRRDTCLSM